MVGTSWFFVKCDWRPQIVHAQSNSGLENRFTRTYTLLYKNNLRQASVSNEAHLQNFGTQKIRYAKKIRHAFLGTQKTWKKIRHAKN